MIVNGRVNVNCIVNIHDWVCADAGHSKDVAGIIVNVNVNGRIDVSFNVNVNGRIDVSFNVNVNGRVNVNVHDWV